MRLAAPRALVVAVVLALAVAVAAGAEATAEAPAAVAVIAEAAAEAPTDGPVGGLVPPTSMRFGDVATYEIVDVRVLEGDLMRVQVELGAIDPSGGLPVGITQPIVEVYLDTGPGGATELLPGSGLRMPPDTGWNLALRVTGDGAWAWQATEEGVVDLAAPTPVEATATGRVVHLLTPFERPPSLRLYAISGVYDPFRPDGWRPLAAAPSPWAFASTDWRLPVVDVFPGDAATLAHAVEHGVLAAMPEARSALGATPWFALMFLGLAIAVLGLWWRRGATAIPATPRRVPADAPAGEPLPSPGRWTTMTPPAPILRGGAPAADDPARAVLIGDDEIDDAVLASARAVSERPEIDEPRPPGPEIEDDPQRPPGDAPEIDRPDVGEIAPHVPEHDEPEIDDPGPDIPGYEEPEDSGAEDRGAEDGGAEDRGAEDRVAEESVTEDRGADVERLEPRADAFARYAAAGDDEDDDLAPLTGEHDRRVDRV